MMTKSEYPRPGTARPQGESRSRFLAAKLAAALRYSALLFLVLSPPAESAVLSDTGNFLFITLELDEQITAVATPAGIYTFSSSAHIFTNGGVDDPGDFSGFGTDTLTLELSGLLAYSALIFDDASSGAHLVFGDSGGEAWQDLLSVSFDGSGSQLTTSGELTTTTSAEFMAETIEIGGDLQTGQGLQFQGAVILTTDSTMTSLLATTFVATIDGAHALVLSSGGTIFFAEDIGATTPLTHLETGMGGNTTLRAEITTSGPQIYANPVSIGSASVLLRAAEIDFDGPSVSGSGSLTMQTFDPLANLAIGFSAPTANFDLTDAELALLADGFASITVGRTDGTGSVNLSSAQFRDPLTLLGGDINLGGGLTQTSGESITLTASGTISSTAGSTVSLSGSPTLFDGRLAPGGSPGIVEVDGDVTLGGAFEIEIEGTTPGTEYDQLRVVGASRVVDLGGVTLSASGLPTQPSVEIVILQLDAASSSISGTFAGLAEGAVVEIGAFEFTITYAGGSGNDVVLVGPEAVFDFGDAPDPGPGTGPGDYQTRLADGGPWHGNAGILTLGAFWDAETDGFDSPDADGDDYSQALPFDEDALALALVDLDVTTGAAHTVVLNATNASGAPATLSGWIDFDRDGVFDNVNERAQTTVSDGTNRGTAALTFPAAPAGSAGSTFARFRLSTDPAAGGPTGRAADGEVEDHRVRVNEPTTGFARTKLSFEGNPSFQNDAFGAAIVEVGDIDRNGIADLVVGSPANAAGLEPAIHVLLMNPDYTIGSRSVIEGVAGSRFGGALAPLGDFDGDLVPDVAVGAFDTNVGGVNQGRLSLLLLNADGTLKGQIDIDSPINEAQQRFARAVANIGDLDGDGIVDLAVSSEELDDEDESNKGAVFIFFMNRDGSVRSNVLIGDGAGGGPSLAHSDRFGTAVVALGDLDGDGVTELAVGARKGGFGRRGAVYILFMNRDGTVRSWVRHASGSPVIGNLSNGDDMGEELAALGDLDGDGIGDLAVGLPGRGNLDRGQVFLLFLRADGSLGSRLVLGHNTNGVGALSANRRFGSGLAKLGDRNGNGVPELAVGSPITANALPDRGRVFELRLNASPVIGETGPVSVTMDEDGSPTPFSLTLNASDGDGDGDTLTWSISSAAGSGVASASGTGTSKAVDYLPNGDFSGTDAFEVAVSDGRETRTITVIVTVNPINDPPAIAAPASISVTEDLASPVTGISFADVDAGSDQVHATLSVPSGALTPTFGTGVVIGGTNSARTLLGTISQLNNYFTNGHLTYTTAMDDTSDVTLGILIDDLGNNGAGSNLTASGDVTLTADPVNDPPEITAPATISLTEDVASAITGISFTDDATGSDPVRATFSVPAGALDATFGTGVVIGGTNTARTLDGTLSQLNTFLANGDLTYTTAMDDTSDVTLGVLIDDLGHNGAGSNLTASQDVTLTVDPVNDPPEITAPATISVTEDVASAVTGISFADVDAGSDQVRATLSVPTGALTPTFGTGVVIGGTNTARTLLGTISQLNNYFANGHLTYTTVMDDTSDVTLGVLIDDLGHNGAGSNETSNQNVTLTVDPVNDPPEITAPATISVTEDVASAVTGISFTDDAAGSDQVLATLSVPTGTLTPTFGTGVVIGGTNTARTLLGTIGQLNNYFANGHLTYTTAMDDTSDVTLGVLIDDLGNNGSGSNETASQDVTLTVDPVNDPPEITAPATISVTEDVASAVTGISFTDDAAGSDQVLATLSVPTGALTPTFGTGVVIGGTNTARTLLGTISQLKNYFANGDLNYTTAMDDTSDVTLGVLIDDLGNSGSGSNETSNQNVTLSVDGVNDPPTITAPGSLAVDLGVATPLTGISFGDPDSGTDPIQVDFSVPAGTLSASSGGGVTVSGTPMLLILEGTLTAVNDFIANESLTYTTHSAGEVTLTVTIDDRGSSTRLTTSVLITLTTAAEADLSVTLSDTADPVLGGADLVYAIDVTNAGPETATHVVVTDTLPAGVAFVSAVGTGWSCGETGGVVTCTRASLPMGVAPVVTLTVATAYDGGDLTNEVAVVADEPDNDGAGATEDTLVLGRFVCNNQAFLVAHPTAQVAVIDTSTTPFGYSTIGGPPTVAVEALGFRRTDGLLYGFRNETLEVVQIDARGLVIDLGLPTGMPATAQYVGDVSDDGTTLYLSEDGDGFLYRVSLSTLTAVTVPILGDSGPLDDWAYEPESGLLYSIDVGDGELAVIDPGTGFRTDFSVPAIPPITDVAAAWVDGQGFLVIASSDGVLVIIDPTGPAIVDIQGLSIPTVYDGAICRQDLLGAAKRMRKTEADLPAAIRLDFRFENLSAGERLDDLDVNDDLSAVLGVHGVDWTFTSISSDPVGFANPSFDGSTDLALVSPGQSLEVGESAEAQVWVELLTDTSGDLPICNQVEARAALAAGTLVADLSTDDGRAVSTTPQSDPNGDGYPIEREAACFEIIDLPVELMRFEIE